MQTFSTKVNSETSIEVFIDSNFVGFIRKENEWVFSPRKNKTFRNYYSSDVLRSIVTFIEVKNKENKKQ